jgi:hypothetical protein
MSTFLTVSCPADGRSVGSVPDMDDAALGEQISALRETSICIGQCHPIEAPCRKRIYEPQCVDTVRC